jgi:hypothetical protein
VVVGVLAVLLPAPLPTSQGEADDDCGDEGVGSVERRTVCGLREKSMAVLRAATGGF